MLAPIMAAATVVGLMQVASNAPAIGRGFKAVRNRLSSRPDANIDRTLQQRNLHRSV